MSPVTRSYEASEPETETQTHVSAVKMPGSEFCPATPRLGINVLIRIKEHDARKAKGS